MNEFFELIYLKKYTHTHVSLVISMSVCEYLCKY